MWRTNPLDLSATAQTLKRCRQATRTSMKILKILLIFLITCTATSCSNQSDKITFEYKVWTTYEPTDNISERRKSETVNYDKNKLYIFFERGFSNDTIQLFENSESKYTMLILTTDASMDSAGEYILDDISKIESISISKNFGPKLRIKPEDKNLNIWTINYKSDSLIATGLRYPPIYE